MKLFLSLLLFPFFCAGQSKDDGYAHAGFSLFGSEKFQTTPGAFIGFGVYTGGISTGAIVDLYTFDKDKIKYAVLSGDFRAYIEGKDKIISPFIAGQPGFVISNKTISGITIKGSFAFAGMVGIRLRPKGKAPGVVFGIGYQNVSFKTNGRITRHGGLKLNLGISI